MSDKALTFLRDSSDFTLQQYELAKRNAAANLSKELKALVLKIVDELVEAEMARRVRDLRESEQITLTSDAPKSILFEPE